MCFHPTFGNSSDDGGDARSDVQGLEELQPPNGRNPRGSCGPADDEQ